MEDPVPVDEALAPELVRGPVHGSRVEVEAGGDARQVLSVITMTSHESQTYVDSQGLGGKPRRGAAAVRPGRLLFGAGPFAWRFASRVRGGGSVWASTTT